MVTMFFRAKKKNEKTYKKNHGPEHKMNAWKGMDILYSKTDQGY